LKPKINFGLEVDTKKGYPRKSKFESNNKAEVMHIRRKPVSKVTTLAQKFPTKVKSKQLPQQRSNESKPHQKFAAENNKTMPKFCPTVFFFSSQSICSQICFSNAPISATA